MKKNEELDKVTQEANMLFGKHKFYICNNSFAKFKCYVLSEYTISFFGVDILCK